MPEQLDYAPTPRRPMRRRWTGLAAFVIVAILVFWHRKELLAQAGLRWAAHECQVYERPADSIAFDADSPAARQLVAVNSAYRLNSSNPYAPWYFRGSAYQPVAPWDAIPAATRGPKIVSGADIPLFVHQRACKGRPTRLVVVELNSERLEGYVINTGHFWQKPTLVWRGPVHNLGENIPQTLGRSSRALREPTSTKPGDGGIATESPARVYFGQVDPNDSAKFTIRVAISGSDFTFEGRLLPDDTIEIEGPLLGEVLKKLSAPQ